MIRRRLAFALATSLSLALAACSDSDGGSSGEPGGGGGGTGTGGGSTDGGNATTGGDEPILDGAFSGVYTVGGDNALAGLALGEDGSAVSLFGPLGGPLDRYDHVASRPATAGVFSAGEFAGQTSDFSVNESGQAVVSDDGTITFRNAASGGLLAATPESVAGNWSGRHRFVDRDDVGSFLVTEVTFSGDTFSGQTRVTDDDGEGTRMNPITSGRLTQSDDALIASFEWNGNLYEGIAFFTPDNTGRLVLVGRTEASDTGNPTIGSLLTIESN